MVPPSPLRPPRPARVRPAVVRLAAIVALAAAGACRNAAPPTPHPTTDPVNRPCDGRLVLKVRNQTSTSVTVYGRVRGRSDYLDVVGPGSSEIPLKERYESYVARPAEGATTVGSVKVAPELGGPGRSRASDLVTLEPVCRTD